MSTCPACASSSARPAAHPRRRATCSASMPPSSTWRASSGCWPRPPDADPADLRREMLREALGALARAAAGGPRLRAVRAARDRAPRGSAARDAGAAYRRRPRRGSPRRARRRAGGARRRPPAEGAPPRPAHARAVPLWPPGRSARGLSQGAPGAGRGARHRAWTPDSAGSTTPFSARTAGLELADAVDRAPPTSRATFVGRERELAELVGGLEDVFAGHGRLFLLVGEPGIGKSGLAEELIAVASARGARVLVGRCWEAGGAPAYWPWVQSLRSLRPRQRSRRASRAAGGRRPRSRPDRPRAARALPRSP